MKYIPLVDNFGKACYHAASKILLQYFKASLKPLFQRHEESSELWLSKQVKCSPFLSHTLYSA